ncbi:ABC transporter permease [Sphingomonas sp. RS6]
MAAKPETPVGLERGLRGSLRVQCRVVYALLMRELLTRYGRNNIGFLWLFLEPMMFTIAITLIWTATRGVHGSSIPITEFALTGYSAMLLWRTLPGRCMHAIQSNVHLLHHRQVTVLDVFYSRILLEQGAVTSSFVILGVLFWIYGWLEPPEDTLKVLAGWSLIAWFGAGLALTMAGLAERFEMIEKLWSPTSYILFPFSGAAFLADSLPEKAREIVLYIPMLHGTELIRDGFFGSYFTPHYDVGYLISWNLGLTLFGLSQVRRIGGGEPDA